MAFALGVASALTGCASWLSTGEADFTCKAPTDGVRCASARTLYSATETSARVDPRRIAPERDATRAPVERTVPAGEPALTIGVDRPVPLRSQAKVLRIWIAPWEDQHGDLHASGLVFSEVEPRRWQVGERMVPKVPLITPLQVTGPSGPNRSPTSSTLPLPTSSGVGGLSVSVDTLQPGAPKANPEPKVP